MRGWSDSTLSRSPNGFHRWPPFLLLSGGFLPINRIIRWTKGACGTILLTSRKFDGLVMFSAVLHDNALYFSRTPHIVRTLILTFIPFSHFPRGFFSAHFAPELKRPTTNTGSYSPHVYIESSSTARLTQHIKKKKNDTRCGERERNSAWARCPIDTCRKRSDRYYFYSVRHFQDLLSFLGVLLQLLLAFK